MFSRTSVEGRPGLEYQQIVAGEDPGLLAGRQRLRHGLVLHAAVQMLRARAGHVLDSDVEAHDAQRAELGGELGGQGLGPAFTDESGAFDLPRAQTVPDGADPRQRVFGFGQQEVVVVEAEHAGLADGVAEPRHFVGDVLGAAEAQHRTAAVALGVAVERRDGAVRAAAPAAARGHDGHEGHAGVARGLAVADGEGQRIEAGAQAAPGVLADALRCSEGEPTHGV